MTYGGHHPVITHFNRFGTLAYRLAAAILGDERAAADAVVDVFSDLRNGDATRLRWHTTLEAVREKCGARLRAGIASRTTLGGPVAPAEVVRTDPDDGAIMASASDVYAALNVLSETDRTLLWSTLMRPNADSEGWEPLSEALRRLEIAISNQDIPGDGAEPWLE